MISEVWKEIQDLIIKHEGKRNKLYKCSEGKWTIGIGHNIEDRGLSDNIVDFIFLEDFSDAYTAAHRTFNRFNFMPRQAQIVFINMSFQLGETKLKGFKNMIANANKADWDGVILEMMDSRWYRQTTDRANELIELIKELV